jgi:hypothetical protein
MWTMGLLLITTYLPILALLSAFSDLAVFAQAFLGLYDEAEPYGVHRARHARDTRTNCYLHSRWHSMVSTFTVRRVSNLNLTAYYCINMHSIDNTVIYCVISSLSSLDSAFPNLL